MKRTTMVTLVLIIGVIVVGVALLLPIFQATAPFTKTIITTTTITETTTTTFTALVPPNAPWNIPYNGAIYYLAVPNQCSGPGGACFSGYFNEAFVFTCLKEAASPQGCMVQINATNSRMFTTVTVWYPYVNKTAGAPSWANCSYDWQGKDPNRLYAVYPSYCIPIGANGFILTQPSGPIP